MQKDRNTEEEAIDLKNIPVLESFETNRSVSTPYLAPPGQDQLIRLYRDQQRTYLLTRTGISQSSQTTHVPAWSEHSIGF